MWLGQAHGITMYINLHHWDNHGVIWRRPTAEYLGEDRTALRFQAKERVRVAVQTGEEQIGAAVQAGEEQIGAAVQAGEEQVQAGEEQIGAAVQAGNSSVGRIWQPPYSVPPPSPPPVVFCASSCSLFEKIKKTTCSVF